MPKNDVYKCRECGWVGEAWQIEEWAHHSQGESCPRCPECTMQMSPEPERPEPHIDQIRCHGPYCSFNYALPSCEICRGTGWHYCRCGESKEVKP